MVPRDLLIADRESTPCVVIVNETAARQWFGGPDVVGKTQQQQQYVSRTTIVARSTHGQRLAADLRTLLASMNPNLPVVTALTLDDYASLGLAPQRIAASISAGLGIVGLLLAAIGIYGVTAYMVTSRNRRSTKRF